MAPLPTGTVTFLFTDLEGSTALWERHPDAMRVALARHDELLRELVESNNGAVFKMVGDACCAAFAVASDALAAAVAAQRAIGREDWGKVGPLWVRIAIHTGAAQEVASDYLGPPVNRVARLLAAAHGGQILVSGLTRQLIGKDRPAGCELRELGRHRLKDLIEAELIYDVVGPGLLDTFPPVLTLDARQSNLPTQPTPLVGRQSELAAVAGLLGDDVVRLVTLTGPGGSGKTRLALQVAAELLDSIHDGVYFVELSAVDDAEQVPAAIAQTLALKELPGRSLAEALEKHLCDRKMLIVLDNLEQLLGSARLLGHLLSRAPRLKLLVTSREPLRISGEHEFSVGPLELPPPNIVAVEDLGRFDAVELFVERARAVDASFALEAGNARAVADICVRLDGLPLAIELAAARVKHLSPEALLPRLERTLTVLTGGARDAPQRQQTLRETIAWSHRLLDQTEQSLFARLAVFAGGCSLDAAEALCGENVLDGLASLVDKSLLRRGAVPAGAEPRFWMLETIHEYAAEQLGSSDEFQELQRRHADFFARLGEEAMTRRYVLEEGAWLEPLECDEANLRAALTWALEHRLSDLAYPLAADLSLLWDVHGLHTEGRQWVARTLALNPPEDRLLLARVLNTQAFLALPQGDLDLAETSGEAALEIYRQFDAKSRTAWTLMNLGMLAKYRGDLIRARAMQEEAFSIATKEGLKSDVAGATLNLGDLDLCEGLYERAESLSVEARRLFTATNDPTGTAQASLNVALARLLGGNSESALPDVGEAISISAELGWTEGIANSLDVLAAVLDRRAEPHAAARLVGASQAIRDETGILRERGIEERVINETLQRLEERLGPEGLSADLQAGAALERHQAVRFALDYADPGGRPEK